MDDSKVIQVCRVIDIEYIMAAYLKDMKPREGYKHISTEWYYDPHKGRVSINVLLEKVD